MRTVSRIAFILAALAAPALAGQMIDGGLRARLSCVDTRRLPPGFAARLDVAGEVDRTARNQQLFRERRLTGVRVRDDRERTSFAEGNRHGV